MTGGQMATLIFDAAIRAGEIAGLERQIAEKKEQIRSVTEQRCGNCFHWMKTTCKPEKQGKRFCSTNSPACNDFSPDQLLSIKFAAKFRQELAELEGKLVDKKKEYGLI